MNAWMKALALALAMHGAAYAGEAAKAAASTGDKAPSSKAEVAKADENRKKPLQRCDELKDQAQLDCLRKARERIVQDRAKRESKGGKS